MENYFYLSMNLEGFPSNIIENIRGKNLLQPELTGLQLRWCESVYTKFMIPFLWMVR